MNFSHKFNLFKILNGKLFCRTIYLFSLISRNQKQIKMDNIQQIADAVQKVLQQIVWASVQQRRPTQTRLTRLRKELCRDSFHAVLALSSGQAKYQCCIATVTVIVIQYYSNTLLKLSSCIFCSIKTFQIRPLSGR